MWRQKRQSFAYFYTNVPKGLRLRFFSKVSVEWKNTDGLLMNESVLNVSKQTMKGSLLTDSCSQSPLGVFKG